MSVFAFSYIARLYCWLVSTFNQIDQILHHESFFFPFSWLSWTLLSDYLESVFPREVWQFLWYTDCTQNVFGHLSSMVKPFGKVHFFTGSRFEVKALAHFGLLEKNLSLTIYCSSVKSSLLRIYLYGLNTYMYLDSLHLFHVFHFHTFSINIYYVWIHLSFVFKHCTLKIYISRSNWCIHVITGPRTLILLTPFRTSQIAGILWSSSWWRVYWSGWRPCLGSCWVFLHCNCLFAGQISPVYCYLCFCNCIACTGIWWTVSLPLFKF